MIAVSISINKRKKYFLFLPQKVKCDYTLGLLGLDYHVAPSMSASVGFSVRDPPNISMASHYLCVLRKITTQTRENYPY